MANISPFWIALGGTQMKAVTTEKKKHSSRGTNWIYVQPTAILCNDKHKRKRKMKRKEKKKKKETRVYEGTCERRWRARWVGHRQMDGHRYCCWHCYYVPPSRSKRRPTNASGSNHPITCPAHAYCAAAADYGCGWPQLRRDSHT